METAQCQKFFQAGIAPPHLGPYPLERLPRSNRAPSTEGLAEIPPLRLPEPENPYSIANSFPRFFELYRRLRNGEVREQAASIPSDPEERLRHLKSLSYFLDASQVGACIIPEDARLGRTASVDFDVAPDSDSGDQEYMYTPSKNGSADDGSATGAIVAPRLTLADLFGRAIVIQASGAEDSTGQACGVIE